MTAMWASLTDAYQIYVTAAANGKTGATAELTLNMKNKLAIATWKCELVLPEGVTYEGVEAVDGRYPAEYAPTFNVTTGDDGVVTIICEGEDGVAITGTEGAVAKVTVKIASDVAPGEYIVKIASSQLTEPGEPATIHNNTKAVELTWTIEQGAEPGIKGDFNGDGKVDIADAVCVLDVMAAGTNDAAYDLNADGKVDIADFVNVLDLMAQQ
jgi:hypothetical protein